MSSSARFSIASPRRSSKKRSRLRRPRSLNPSWAAAADNHGWAVDRSAQSARSTVQAQRLTGAACPTVCRTLRTLANWPASTDCWDFPAALCAARWRAPAVRNSCWVVWIATCRPLPRTIFPVATSCIGATLCNSTGHEIDSSTLSPSGRCRPASKRIPPLETSTVCPVPVSSTRRRRMSFHFRSSCS